MNNNMITITIHCNVKTCGMVSKIETELTGLNYVGDYIKEMNWSSSADGLMTYCPDHV